MRQRRNGLGFCSVTPSFTAGGQCLMIGPPAVKPEVTLHRLLKYTYYYEAKKYMYMYYCETKKEWTGVLQWTGILQCYSEFHGWKAVSDEQCSISNSEFHGWRAVKLGVTLQNTSPFLLCLV